MLRKNTAGQFLHVAAVNATTGAALTGATLSCRRCIDGTFAGAGATITEDTGLGFYKVALTQADTNGNDIGYFFTATNMIPVQITVVTTAADPTDSVRFGLTALPNAAAGANTGLPVVGTQVPNATAGASNGLLISGTNSGTTTLGAFTITGSMTVSDGLLVSRSTANASAITATGNGTGNGAVFTSGSGATGDGVQITAASTNGNGLVNTKTGTGLALKGATTDLTLAKTTNITGFNDIAATSIVSSGAITTSGGAVSTVSAVTGLTASNLDVAVSSRMATYTQPTGFLAATFPSGTIANTTNITAGTITTATNLTTNNDKTGYSIATGGVINGANAAAELNNIADAILDRVMSAGTDSGTDTTTGRTVRQALRALRNKVAIAAGTMTVYKEGDAVASWTSAITTTAGNPISSSDPT
jgi:hypothetical protein